MPPRSRHLVHQGRRWLTGIMAGLILTQSGPAIAQQITHAYYGEPTSDYPHGVLGDDEEWGTVFVTVKREAGKEGGLFQGNLDLTYKIAAQADSVFEDTAPRLWDVTGDGEPEVVVVESHQNKGARLMIIGLIDGTLEYLAATPHIGQRFRWLAPVGAADFNGDGQIEVAYVDRPHLAKTLRVWQYANGAFTQIATMPGLSNHRIGEDFITGGIRDCGEGPEMILPDADWRNIMAARLTLTSFGAQPVAPFTGAESIQTTLACN